MLEKYKHKTTKTKRGSKHARRFDRNEFKIKYLSTYKSLVFRNNKEDKKAREDTRS